MAFVDVQVEGMEEALDYIDHVRSAYPDAFSEGARDFMVDVFNMSQTKVPVDNGLLRESGHIDISGNVLEISYSAPYAAAVHWGYKRHYIKPVRRKALRWEVGRKARLSRKGSRKNARWAFSKGHYVPRDRAHTEPRPFLTEPFIKGVETGLLEMRIIQAIRRRSRK